MSSLSERIRIDVEKAGYSMRELEAMTGIPSSSIQRYLTKETDNIPIGRLEALAKAVGTSAQKWLGWDDDTSANPTNEFAELFSRLSTEQQKTIVNLIEELLNK